MCTELEFTHKLNSMRVVKITRADIKVRGIHHNLHGSVQNPSLRRRPFSAHKIILKYHWSAFGSDEVSHSLRRCFEFVPNPRPRPGRFLSDSRFPRFPRKFIKIKQSCAKVPAPFMLLALIFYHSYRSFMYLPPNVFRRAPETFHLATTEFRTIYLLCFVCEQINLHNFGASFLHPHGLP